MDHAVVKNWYERRKFRGIGAAGRTFIVPDRSVLTTHCFSRGQAILAKRQWGLQGRRFADSGLFVLSRATANCVVLCVIVLCKLYQLRRRLISSCSRRLHL